MLTNPALAKVVYLNCDVFSLGKIKRKDDAVDEFIRAINKPNHFQTLRQFLWSYRFWIMFGNAYLKPNTKILANERLQLYWINSSCIDWGKETTDQLDKFILSNQSFKRIEDLKVTYTFNDGTKTEIKLGELIPFQDLTNNTGNWYRGNSRIDALHKIISNNESGLDAKNINLEFSRKFLVSGNYDPAKNLEGFSTMQDLEKENINQKLRGNEAVIPLKAQADIKRFVENLAKLELDDSYNEDLMKIGSIYNMPTELLDTLKEGATYENQDAALSRHICYSEMPKAQDLLEGLCNYFGVNVDDYEMSWDYLPFMQEDEKDRAEVNSKNALTLEQLVKMGADRTEAAEYLRIDLEFSDERAEQNRQGNDPQNEAEEADED